MKDSGKNAVIILARNLEAGKVKTRLAKTLGNDFALQFYKLCSEKIFEESKKLIAEDITVHLFYAGEQTDRQLIDRAGFPFSIYRQQGDNLGSRMKNAFNKIFNENAAKAIIIGTDVPDLDSGFIIDAFNMLDTNDAVIGPAADGGYYLLGLKRPFDVLFDKIAWSTGSVFNNTVMKMRKSKIKYRIMPELNDIDTVEDLMRWLSADNLRAENSFKIKIRRMLDNLNINNAVDRAD